ncbi:MAG: prenyltransferase [Anaerolineales bacterium]|nr:prenyltransferase [Anaerolineales bacterium]
MTNSKPVEEQTVKALSWQLLYGNYRPKLGKQGWEALETTVGAPEFRGMDPDEDCPMEPFNQAVLWIDETLGRGDGTLIEEITIASVERWASMFRNLVKQLQGRPQKMMEIFCTEVHPYFLNDPSASLIVASDENCFVLKMDNGLLESFKTGLVEGFCEIVGAEAKVIRRGDEYHVTWSIQEDTPAPSRWALFVNATRLPFLTASVIPVLVGTAIAWREGKLDLPAFLLALAGAALFHLGANVINDYFDHRSGADEANLTPTPFSGGSRVIQRGLFKPKQTLRLAAIVYALGALTGIGLIMRVGWPVALFGLAGFLAGYLYTAPPFRLVHRGVGELAVGAAFGPVILLGAYWVQTQRFSLEALVASLPIGLLVAAILYINEVPDRPWDQRAGKGTVVVRLPGNLLPLGYLLLVGVSYALILIGVILGWLAPAALLVILTLPIAWSAYRMLRRHQGHPYRLIPANAMTILIHLLAGMLLFWAYIGTGLVERVIGAG